jgi:hypothetical protein
MTHKRSWLALAALCAAIIGGAVWAQVPADPPSHCCPVTGCCTEPKGPTKATVRSDDDSATTDKPCCEGKCCKEKGCCEGKCCAAENGKDCCAGGKCCASGKTSRTVTLPVAPGSEIHVTIAPHGSGPEAYAADWAYPAPPMPPPLPSAPVPFAQYFPAPCIAPPPPPVACMIPPPIPPAHHHGVAWQLRPVVMNDHPCLVMQWDGDEATRVVSEEMTVQMGHESLKVVAGEKRIHVCGSCVKGSADLITRNPADGGIVMEGHVKMHYEKDGQKVEVSAEHVAVGVADGRIEVTGLHRAADMPRPCEKSCPACPACPPASGADLHLFDFWTGFFR